MPSEIKTFTIGEAFYNEKVDRHEKFVRYADHLAALASLLDRTGEPVGAVISEGDQTSLVRNEGAPLPMGTLLYATLPDAEQARLRERWTQDAIDNAPLSLRLLGETLSNKLDADEWNNAEPLLVSIAARLAQAERATAVTVKPLEWGGDKARTSFGDYEIIDARSCGLGFGLRKPDSSEKIFIKSRAAAYKLAQADFEARILSALAEPQQAVTEDAK